MNREDLIVERCRTAITQNQGHIAVAMHTVDLLKTFNQQLNFISRAGLNDDELDMPSSSFRTHLQLPGERKHRKPMSAAARKRISQGQRKRWLEKDQDTDEKKDRKQRYAKVLRGNNSDQPRWTESDDNKIIAFVQKKEQASVNDIKNALHPALKGRTRNAIHQRVYKLLSDERLQRVNPGKHPGTPLFIKAA